MEGVLEKPIGKIDPELESLEQLLFKSQNTVINLIE